VFTHNSWSEVANLAPLGGFSDDKHLSFVLAVELNLAGGFAWWPNLGNLARLTRSSRAAFWPNWVAWPWLVAVILGPVAILVFFPSAV
jgi:NCS1 family nucleobase:cation symporter-1